MIENIVIVVCCIVFSSIFDSEKDTIQYKPKKAWFSWKWWLESNYLIKTVLISDLGEPIKRILYLLLKYPFSFVINGWHFCKSLSIVFLLITVSLVTGAIPWYYTVPIAYVLYGTIFNLSYDY